ncbi:MAG: acyl-CoA dehydrogenase family protein [Ilumatobacteraceae bacterium]
MIGIERDVMDLMPSAEQEEIAATVAAFLADRMPVVGRGRDHVVAAPEIADDLWRDCTDLGWLSLGLSESAGGVGFTLVEEMMLFRELGRGVAPGPFLPGVLGAHLAAAAGDPDLTESIASGATKVALGTPIGPAELRSSVSCEVSVVHVDGAEYILVCDDRSASLVPTERCELEAIDPVEGSITTGRGRLDGVSSTVYVDAATEPIFLRGLVLAAAAATGVAEAVLDVAVAYAGTRVQFGKPIGTFQAIKHRCADMKVSADGAYAQASYAAVAVRDGLDGAALEAAIAKYVADEAARVNSEGAVQIHGAMGFTSEAVPYRYVARAHLLGRCLASRAELLDRIIGRNASSEAEPS